MDGGEWDEWKGDFKGKFKGFKGKDFMKGKGPVPRRVLESMKNQGGAQSNGHEHDDGHDDGER